LHLPAELFLVTAAAILQLAALEQIPHPFALMARWSVVWARVVISVIAFVS
jgi:hypothetical protein